MLPAAAVAAVGLCSMTMQAGWRRMMLCTKATASMAPAGGGDTQVHRTKWCARLPTRLHDICQTVSRSVAAQSSSNARLHATWQGLRTNAANASAYSIQHAQTAASACEEPRPADAQGFSCLSSRYPGFSSCCCNTLGLLAACVEHLCARSCAITVMYAVRKTIKTCVPYVCGMSHLQVVQ